MTKQKRTAAQFFDDCHSQIVWPIGAGDIYLWHAPALWRVCWAIRLLMPYLVRNYANPTGDFELSVNASDGWFSWQTANGSHLNLNASLDDDLFSTPLRQVPAMLGNYLAFPYKCAYAIQGVCISSGAIGVPYDF